MEHPLTVFCKRSEMESVGCPVPYDTVRSTYVRVPRSVPIAQTMIDCTVRTAVYFVHLRAGVQRPPRSTPALRVAAVMMGRVTVRVMVVVGEMALVVEWVSGRVWMRVMVQQQQRWWTPSPLTTVWVQG